MSAGLARSVFIETGDSTAAAELCRSLWLMSDRGSEVWHGECRNINMLIIDRRTERTHRGSRKDLSWHIEHSPAAARGLRKRELASRPVGYELLSSSEVRRRL